MIRTIFAFLALFTTPEEKRVCQYHYSQIPITERYYYNDAPRLQYRFYIDTTINKSNGDKLTSFHFESGTFGLGYDHHFTWGTINNRFHVFVFDSTPPDEGDIPIRRGIE